MSGTVNTIERILERLIRIEYGTVIRTDPKGIIGVQCRDDPEGKNWNTVTVRFRSSKTRLERPTTPRGMTGTPEKAYHYYCTVLQGYSQKWAGEPYTPRIGDMVAVLFVHNQKPIILGTIPTDTQDPVCRSPFDVHNYKAMDARYDLVRKWCQWEEPTFNHNEEVTEHFPGKNPICEKIFHKNRDQIKVTDCKEGNKSACKCCKMLDHIKRCSNQWEKIYSCETCSSDPEHPYLPHKQSYTKKRHEWHEPSGSYIVLQNNPCGDSDYGKGLIRIENATCENCMKGHFNMDPKGTIDLHTKHCDNPYATENLGTRMSVVALEDTTVDHSFEAIDFYKNSFIEILKNGNITLSSLSGMSSIWIDGTTKTITLNGIDYIEEIAGEEIELNTPLVHITGNLVVDGCLTHGGGSCCGGGWST